MEDKGGKKKPLFRWKKVSFFKTPLTFIVHDNIVIMKTSLKEQNFVTTLDFSE